MTEISKQFATELLGMIQGTKDFVLDQAPDVARQIVAYGFWSNLAWLMVFTAWAISYGLFVRKTVKVFNSSKPYSDARDWHAGLCVVGGIATVLCTVLNLTLVLPEFLKAAVAPKLYLIDYLLKIVA